MRTLGLPTTRVVPILLFGGGFALVGYTLGGRLADAVGRRRAFLLGASGFTLGELGYYALSSHAIPMQIPVLAISLVLLSTCGSISMVAFRALATELFPVRMRGTLGGWLAVGSAAGWLLAMGATSLLAATLGGLGNAAALRVVLCLPAASGLLLGLPETHRRTHEAPLRETPPAHVLER